MTPHPRAVGAALTAAVAFLLLWRLGTPLLWQDEAETANVALGVLESGYPTPLLGETEPGVGHLVTQQAGRDAVRVGDRVLWSWHPWPQHYLAAAGMALFGRGTWQARLPFALISLACVPLFYAWRLRRGDATVFAAVATAVFALSPAFYLFARQCRYYPLLFVGGLWAAWSYDGLLTERAGSAGRDGRAGPLLGLALALALVFYANPLTGVALASGFAVHAGWSWRCGRLRRPAAFLASFALFALLAAPWLALVAVSEVRAPALGLAGRLTIAATQVWRIQYVLLPVVLWPVLAWWLVRTRRGERRDETGRSLRDDVALLAVLLTVSWLVVSLQAPLGTARYVLPLWPLAAVAVAAVWRLLHRRSTVAGGLFLAVVLLTDLLPSLPAAPVAWARPGRTVYDREAGALDKLAHQGRVGLTLPRDLATVAARRCGPVAAVVGVGRQLRRAPRVIVTDYAQESLRFYLGGSAQMPAQAAAARKRLGLAPARLGTESDPFGRVDLVVPRRGWPPETAPVLAAGGFVAVRTGVPDHAYENLPDPTGHRWGPAADSPARRPLPELVAWVRPELVPEGGFGPLAAPGCAPFPAPTVVASSTSSNDPEPP